MPIRQINTGSDIATILNGKPNGKLTDYIVVDNPKTELERLVYFADKKIAEGKDTFIKVKFDWKLGLRARVLDIVCNDSGIITIYKLASASNFDRHTIDLERISVQLNLLLGVDKENISCCLIVSDENQYKKIKALLSDTDTDFNVEIL